MGKNVIPSGTTTKKSIRPPLQPTKAETEACRRIGRLWLQTRHCLQCVPGLTRSRHLLWLWHVSTLSGAIFGRSSSVHWVGFMSFALRCTFQKDSFYSFPGEKGYKGARWQAFGVGRLMKMHRFSAKLILMTSNSHERCIR